MIWILNNKKGRKHSLSFQMLDKRIQKVLEELNITPTPGQLEYLKSIISYEDVLVIASTGSGKTFGTAIACIHNILTNSHTPISTIIITPLKALNRDIFRRVLPQLAEKLGISIAVRHGDTPKSERARQTKKPPQILITTPELFQAILPAKILGREYLKNVKTVVIDEIHELVSTKRGIQLSLALERLCYRASDHVQRIGLSATLGNPEEVMNFLAPTSYRKRIVEIPPLKKLQIKIEFPTLLPVNGQEFSKTLHTTDEAASRFLRVVEIVKKEKGTVLLFTNTRQQAEILGYRFNRYNEVIDESERINFEVHHSSLSSQSRMIAEHEVRAGNLDLIIATSSLELGIDIGAISLVIQYMSPRQIETIIQRIGRSGHGLDLESKGIIITETPRELLESYLIKTLVNRGKIESSHIHNAALDILFHAIIGILLDHGKTSVRKILMIITNAQPFLEYTAKDLLPLLEYGRDNYFFFIDKDQETNEVYLRAKRKAYKYYYSNLSSIPTKKSYHVFDVGRKERVGQLDESFVATRGEKGTIFILNGLPWEFLSIKDDRIEVRQVKSVGEAAIPTWEGELIPVSKLVTQSALDLFESENPEIHESPSINKEIHDFIYNQKLLGKLPRKNCVLIESTGLSAVFHTFLGSKGNDTLGLLLTSIIGAKQGLSVQYRADPYSVFISLPRPIDFHEIIFSINPKHIGPLLRERILNSDLFAWRIRQVAQRFGAITDSVENSPMMTRIILSRYKNTIIGEETLNEIFSENMDIETVIDFFSDISSGKLQIEVVRVESFDSPLAAAATQPISLNVLKIRPSHVILNKIEKRLENTWIRLVCMRIGCKFEKTQRIASLPDIIRCPQCQSRYVAVVHPTNTTIKKLLNRSVSKNPKDRLTKDERRELNTAKKSADLILSFGKSAAFILAGRGIGPKTAVRILREPHKNTEDLLASIYEHEANFSRTREYWG